MIYDVIVVGGGHAGIEAALAPARMGCQTLMVTGDINRIGHMPCNPAIGGPAKGIVVMPKRFFLLNLPLCLTQVKIMWLSSHRQAYGFFATNL